MAPSVMQTSLPLHNRRQGKVRDVYDATLSDGVPAVVMIATDRLSAFDVVMPTPVPGKGVILTQLSNFWFDMIREKLGEQLEHHVISTDATDLPTLSAAQQKEITGRVTIGKRCSVVPIECVVRGYLAGSGWAEYQRTQSVCGVKLPAGLKQCDQLPEPIFTPATKAATGHDENVSFEVAAGLVGLPLMSRLRDLSIAIYTMARDYAATRGIIIADTKFEFGLPVDTSGAPHKHHHSPHASHLPFDADAQKNTPDDVDDDATAALPVEPILIDEVLTPDSSRFWPADRYQPGKDQPSFDKQQVRNYLQSLCDAGKWNKQPPGPVLPEQVVNDTLDRYREAYRMIVGHAPTV